MEEEEEKKEVEQGAEEVERLKAQLNNMKQLSKVSAVKKDFPVISHPSMVSTLKKD